MPRLAASSHADTGLRILRIVRRGDRHDPRELTASIRFEGDFERAFLEGRTEGIIPPKTIRSFVRETVQVLGDAELESLGLALCSRVLQADSRIGRVRVELAEQPWSRLAPGGKAQGQSFMLNTPEQRSAVVTSNGLQSAVVSGIEQLVLMRTSGFLPARTEHRADDGSEDAVPALLVGTLSARWSYGTPEVAFGPYRQGVRAVILDTFAMHTARSVQYTLYAIAEVVLEAYPDVLDILLTLHERTPDPAEFFRNHASGPEDLFVPADDPVRTVEVRVERGQASGV